jgi:hypothetical protein
MARAAGAVGATGERPGIAAGAAPGAEEADVLKAVR